VSRRGVSARLALSAAALAMGLSAAAEPKPAWPGDTVRWGATGTAELAMPLAPAVDGTAWQPGLGFRLGWRFQESRASTGVWGLEAGAQSLPRSAAAGILAPWAGLSWAWPLSLGKLLRFSPGLGLGAEFAIAADPVAPAAAPPAVALSPGFRAEIVLPLELHLGAFRFLRLEPALSLASSRGWLPVFSIGLGLREELVSLVPEPEGYVVKPYLVLTPRLFSPDHDREDDSQAILIHAGAGHYVGGWSIEVFDPDGAPFRRWSGTGAPPERVVWDGAADNGAVAASCRDYRVVFSALDRFGVRASVEAVSQVDVLTERQEGLRRLLLPVLRLPEGASGRGDGDGAALLSANRPVIDRLAAWLARWPDATLRIRGGTWAEGLRMALVLEGVATKRLLAQTSPGSGQPELFLDLP
jgi:hypothetical protein